MKDTREHIINSYLTLGAEKGYDNTSLSDIAEKTGIKKSSIFSHFKSYEELKEVALSYALTELNKLSKSMSIPTGTVPDKILDLLLKPLLSTLLSEPVIYLIFMCEQKKTYNTEYNKISENISFMIYSRLEVALDFTGHSENAELYADLLTSYIRDYMSHNISYNLTNNICILDDIFSYLNSFIEELHLLKKGNTN